MKTLATAFKEVYGEGLKPLGFTKLKGKYPYYVRVIDGEIIHVITFTPDRCLKQNYKEFIVWCGVATVYRGGLTFNINPKDNVGWFTNTAGMYVSLQKSRECKVDLDYLDKIHIFEYEKDNEVSMVSAVAYSWEVTQKHIIPALDKVKNIRNCMEYYDVYDQTLCNIYSDDDFGKRWNGYKYNEGLLNVMVYDSDEFAKHENYFFKKMNKQILHEMQTGECGHTEETYEKDKSQREVWMQEQIQAFEKISTEPVYSKVKEELQRRKRVNQNVLMDYGLNIE